MAVVFLRHGPTVANDPSAERLRGWLDFPLTDGGVKLAEIAAAHLRAFAIDHIYASDLLRAAETAEIWSHDSGVPLSLHEELRPWHLGDLQGQPVDLVDPIISSLVHSPHQPAPSGESFRQFTARYVPFILPLVTDSALHGIVSHIRNIKVLEATLANGGSGIHTPTWDLPPTVGPGEAVYFDRTHMAQSPARPIDRSVVVS